MVEEAISQEEAAEKFYGFMIQKMKSGTSVDEITNELVDMGVDRKIADKLVKGSYDQITKVAEEKKATSQTLLPATLGGLLAALVGGAVWALIAEASGYEIGFMAIGMGILSGEVVVLCAQGKKGPPLQIIAVLSSILGILVANYIMFFNTVKELAIEEYGEEIVSLLSMFNSDLISTFFEGIGDIFSDGYGILWMILAIFTAWKIPRSVGIKSPASK